MESSIAIKRADNLTEVEDSEECESKTISRKQVLQVLKEEADSEVDILEQGRWVETVEQHGALITQYTIDQNSGHLVTEYTIKSEQLKEEPGEYLILAEEYLDEELIAEDIEEDHLKEELGLNEEGPNEKEEPDENEEGPYENEDEPDENEEEIDANEEEDLELEIEFIQPKKPPSFVNSREDRGRKRSPKDGQSTVKYLCENYPELANDKELLVLTLCERMFEVKRPDLPEDCYAKIKDKFQCGVCAATCDTEPAIGRHWQEKHGPRYLLCYACGDSFRSTTSLYRHEKNCASPDAVAVLKARARFLGRKGRSRPYLKPKELTPIIRRKERKPKPCFKCDLCPAQYKSKRAIEAHLFAHQGKRPYKCDMCTQAYSAITALTNHRINKHSGDQFICEHCSKHFSSKHSLTTHLDTHQPVPKFLCTLCGKRYSQNAALKLHIHREHEKLPPACPCQLCGKRFPKKYRLKMHMLKVHGMNLITRNMVAKAMPRLPKSPSEANAGDEI